MNSTPLTQIYCTRPNCQYPINNIPQEQLNNKPIRQRFCSNCGMPLILEGSFLPLDLLVPDQKRGGFGRTFLAQDLNFPDRPLRVIKQLHPRNIYGQQTLEIIETMFQREASVLERLRHPQIPLARALLMLEAPADLQEKSHQQSVGNNNFFYLIQDYITGDNLDTLLRKKGKFSEHEVVKVLQEILNILDYVHQEGVIHRDIKPSNIMNCHHNNKFYLIDFGAVKQVVVAGIPTEQSIVIGTPDFAPPEQLAGRPVSASSDLYSLAATCVCLLTGNHSTQKLRNDDTWNWTENINVSDNFANILQRMLSPFPENRFQSAQEVIAAINAPTNPQLNLDNTITIPPTQNLYNSPTKQSVSEIHNIGTTVFLRPFSWLFVYKFKISIFIGIISLFSMGVFILVSEERPTPISRRKQMRHQIVEENQVLKSLKPIETSIKKKFSIASSEISDIAISPDLQIIAGRSNDAKIHIWNIDTGELLANPWQDSGQIGSLAFSLDGRTIASGGLGNNNINLWQISTDNIYQRSLSLQGANYGADFIVFSPDGNRLFVGDSSNKIKIWQLPNPKPITLSRQSQGTVKTLAISKDGNFLVSGSLKGEIEIWNLNSQNSQNSLYLQNAHPNQQQSIVSSIVIDDNKSQMISGGFDGTIKIWNLKNGEILRTINDAPEKITSLAISPNQNYIISASRDGVISKWDINNGKLIKSYKLLDYFSENISKINFRNQDVIVAGYDANNIKFWEIPQILK